MYNSCSYSCMAALLLILILFVILGKNTLSALKDMSDQTGAARPFSLARTTLFFWSLIIFISICYIGIVTGSLPSLNDGLLQLMGIAVGTTATGATIDSIQSQDEDIPRFQDTIPSEGFLKDILSDKMGISTSRLQTLIFNIIYGCFFISQVIKAETLYDFPSKTLVLLGISSGAYAIIKVTENRKPTHP